MITKYKSNYTILEKIIWLKILVLKNVALEVLLIIYINENI